LKVIALIEDSWTGHRPTYLKLFNKTLLELGHQVITCCPEPQELEDWIKEHCQPEPEQYQIFEFRKPPSTKFPLQQLHPILNAVNLWCGAKVVADRAFRKLEKVPDLVFFCVLDGYLTMGLTHYLIDWIFPYQWSGLYFHPRHIRLKPKLWSSFPTFAQPHAALHSSHCPVVALLDEGITDRFQDRLSGKRVINFPDCIDASEPDFSFPLIKQIQEKAQGRKIIGLLGSQSKRKSIFTLIKVAQKMRSEPFFFLFAGNLYPKTFTKEEHSKILEIISLNLENCFFYWQVIPEPRFNALVLICDILFAAYERFPHSSNMLNKASNFAKPIIISKNYCMAERVEKFNLGVSIHEGNVEECIEAIHLLGSTPLNDPDFQGYLDAHTIDKLPPAFQKILECSSPTTPQLLSR